VTKQIGDLFDVHASTMQPCGKSVAEKVNTRAAQARATEGSSHCTQNQRGAAGFPYGCQMPDKQTLGLGQWAPVKYIALDGLG
jgi:hypothetical protein